MQRSGAAAGRQKDGVTKRSGAGGCGHASSCHPLSLSLSVTVGILMALASLFVLIYFTHDVAEAVQAPHIAARLARELNTSIDRLFPEKVGTVEDGESTPRPRFPPL